jgi:hypothetical protein
MKIIMTKYFVVFVILLPIVSLAQSSQSDEKVDLFLEQQFDFLDDQIDSLYTSDQDYWDDMKKIPSTIDFFERLTGIKAEKSLRHEKILQRKTIDSWKKWTKENRKLLIWDSLRSMVNRTDGDIFK